MAQVHVSSAYQHGSPLRSWTDEPPEVAASAAELAIKASEAFEAIGKLISGDALSSAEEVSLGRLNSRCFLMGYEPMVLLIDVPRLDPAISPLLLRYSKYFRA